MVHFQQQSAHVHTHTKKKRTEYMNFPCDASSSPQKSSYGRSQDTLLIGIPSRRKQPAAAVQWPWVLGRNKLAGEQYLLRFEQDRIKEEEEKSSLKYCSFLSKIASLRLSLQANERVRPCRLAVSSAASSRAVPQRPLF